MFPRFADMRFCFTVTRRSDKPGIQSRFKRFFVTLTVRDFAAIFWLLLTTLAGSMDLYLTGEISSDQIEMGYTISIAMSLAQLFRTYQIWMMTSFTEISSDYNETN